MTHSPSAFQRAFAALFASAGFIVEPKDVRYSLGYCQGDGASFSGSVDFDSYIRTLVRENTALAIQVRRACDAGELSVRVTQSDHRYCHAYTMSVDAEYRGESGDVEAVMADLEKDMLERARSIATEAEKLGYALIDTTLPTGEVREVYREACGQGALVIVIIGTEYDTDDTLDGMEPEDILALLRSLHDVPHRSHCCGDLELRYVDEDDDHVTIETVGGSVYDLRAGTDQFTGNFDMQDARATYGLGPQQLAA